jgi:hypothetical protein
MATTTAEAAAMTTAVAATTTEAATMTTLCRWRRCFEAT